MAYICARLVSVAHTNHFFKVKLIMFYDSLVLYLNTTSLNSLKVMKKSPITEYSDPIRWMRLMWISRALWNHLANGFGN